eukprot:TRINITY_DN1381_c0_g1_i1.p1 TRINITY_DN1381_c0_g1~~TRINITY_DN1381_c0_g1_i1.p1  ORF type:complete len:288 (+),score=43.60 TRINITY_DN1381_c0_g1_i1:58-921(+)
MSDSRVIKEDWFRKKGGKKTNFTNKVSEGSRRYFVLTERYLENFVSPRGSRKGTIPIDSIYLRKAKENNALVIGEYGRGKEFRIVYEGPNATLTIEEWYEAITKAIEDYRKSKVNSKENKKIVRNAGIEREGDYLEGNDGREQTFVEESYQTIYQPGSAPEAPQVTQTVNYSQGYQQPMQTGQPMMQTGQPMMQQTTTSYGQPMMQTGQPMMQQTNMSYGQPMMQQTTTYGQPMMPMQQTVVQQQPQPNWRCMYCGSMFFTQQYGMVPCPYCRQVNQIPMQMQTSYY